jgi:SAM-dependent methyltransferase
MSGESAQTEQAHASPGGSCLVCGESGLSAYLDILLKCPSCGFVTARMDEPSEVRSIYEGDYFCGEEYLDYQADEAFFRENFRRRLREVRQRKAGGRLLEIGAAYGFFLDEAKRHFDVVGFEVNPQAVRHARDELGLNVRGDDFLETPPADLEPFDVTAMWDVIEHVPRPDLFLARIAELSKPGALLYLTTGDIGSLVARWRGRRWRMIHPPSHLHYFSRDTLSRLLANHGFRVIETKSVGVARSWHQVLYSILAMRMKMGRAYESLKRAIPATWGFTLNLFDIVQIVAEKRAD